MLKKFCSVDGLYNLGMCREHISCANIKTVQSVPRLPEVHRGIRDAGVAVMLRVCHFLDDGCYISDCASDNKVGKLRSHENLLRIINISSIMSLTFI